MIWGTHYTLIGLLQSQMWSAKWPWSYPEDPSARGAGCKGTQSMLLLEYLFHTGPGASHQCSIKKKITRPTSSFLAHRLKICPLAETALSFLTEKVGKKRFFFFLLHYWDTCYSPGKCSGVRRVWCNVYHRVNKWQSANAAVEWNIANRPECKWGGMTCLPPGPVRAGESSCSGRPGMAWALHRCNTSLSVTKAGGWWRPWDSWCSLRLLERHIWAHTCWW